MKRAQETISFGIIVLSIYLAFFFGLVPTSAKVQEDIIPVIPFWAVVSFGSYILAKLGYGVLTFNDVPDAHAELLKEIDQARDKLPGLGVSVDVAK